MIRPIAALACLLMATGCGAQAIGAASGELLLTQLPSPLPQTVATTQDLTEPDQVAAATPADAAAVSQMLAGSSFKDARVRVWTQDADDYVTVILVAFDRASDAGRLVQVEVNDMSGGSNTFVTPHTALPGSYVFVIHGATRQAGHAVVCEGVWAPVHRFAIETLTCSATGAWATQAEQLAQQESDLVKQVPSS
ncbi:MAG TPA: hypothetical protein VN193_12170 [Candidatus Angelobacter sp.]|jgi:hypothetical protein|nr:hypothetical protein [Candidatus Angelobacter sp.]